MSYPESYRYAKSHEWLAMNGETASVGITDYAQESLGDIVFVELPKVGQQLEAGASFGSVESVKAVSDLYAPVSGTVTEVNESLNSAPETINERRKCHLADQDHGHESGRGECTALCRGL